MVFVKEGRSLKIAHEHLSQSSHDQILSLRRTRPSRSGRTHCRSRAGSLNVAL